MVVLDQLSGELFNFNMNSPSFLRTGDSSRSCSTDCMVVVVHLSLGGAVCGLAAQAAMSEIYECIDRLWGGKGGRESGRGERPECISVTDFSSSFLRLSTSHMHHRSRGGRVGVGLLWLRRRRRGGDRRRFL